MHKIIKLFMKLIMRVNLKSRSSVVLNCERQKATHVCSEQYATEYLLNNG